MDFFCFLWESFQDKLPEWISAIAACIAAFGVWYVRQQLKLAEMVAQLQFEDSLDKEYRDLAARIPTKALLGASLFSREHEDAFDEFYRYFDLCNQQIFLRKNKRISKEVWTEWCSGMQYNLEKLPAFQRAWTEIKSRCESFQELRDLEAARFLSDPAAWVKS